MLTTIFCILTCIFCIMFERSLGEELDPIAYPMVAEGQTGDCLTEQEATVRDYWSGAEGAEAGR